MKKWLDDLYAILLKRGFITLDNVLKKYKTEIEDYEELKINDNVISLGVGETVSFDLTRYFSRFDRFMFYNRGYTANYCIVYNLYKYRNDYVYPYFSVNTHSNLIETSISELKRINIKNVSTDTVEFDFYVKKIS